MDAELNHLISTLENSVQVLQSKEVYKELGSSLHANSEGKLPSSETLAKVRKISGLVGELTQLIEPAHTILADHFLGYVNTKCLCAVVELGVPDVLKKHGPLSIGDLAKACNAQPDRLKRILRVLYNNGIFSFDSIHHIYANNHVSELLVSDHWTRWNLWATMYGNRFYDIARGIPRSVMASATRSPAQIEFDTDEDFVSIIHRQGWMSEVHQTLGAGAISQAPGMLADYPWNEVENETVTDIGGGGGQFLACLLRKFPTMRGVIFDLPKVIQQTTELFHSKGGPYSDLSERVPSENLISGDFFHSVPHSKIYVIKWTLHNWLFDDAVRIMTNIRNALLPGPNSRLIVLDAVVMPGRENRLSRYADIQMMMAANGGERTLTEWQELAAESGWVISSISQLRLAWPCAIEMLPRDELSKR